MQSGQFPDANIFPKLVTVIDLTKVTDPASFVDSWQQHYWPTLKRVRQGLLTSLHKVIYDASDYPHWDTEFPENIEHLSRREDLDEEAKKWLLAESAKKLYNLQ